MVKKKSSKKDEKSDYGIDINIDPENFIGYFAIPEDQYETFVQEITNVLVKDILTDDELRNMIMSSVGKQIDDIVTHIQIFASIEALAKKDFEQVKPSEKLINDFNMDLMKLIVKYILRGVPLSALLAIMYSRVSQVLTNELSEDIYNRVKQQINKNNATPSGYI